MVSMLANFEKRNYNGKEACLDRPLSQPAESAHWHLESELIYVESGEIIISDNHEKYPLPQEMQFFFKVEISTTSKFSDPVFLSLKWNLKKYTVLQEQS